MTDTLIDLIAESFFNSIHEERWINERDGIVRQMFINGANGVLSAISELLVQRFKDGKLFGVIETEDRLRQPINTLDKCPSCGGPADNVHDREYPPNPYFCTKCDQSTNASVMGDDSTRKDEKRELEPSTLVNLPDRPSPTKTPVYDELVERVAKAIRRVAKYTSLDRYTIEVEVDKAAKAAIAAMEGK